MKPISVSANGPPSGSAGVFAFYGADRVDAIDGFLVFNQPGTILKSLLYLILQTILYLETTDCNKHSY